MLAASDRTLVLADKRVLGYAEYGAVDGFPVVYAHGGLACRLDVLAGAASAGECGVRLIAVDRPGIATSDSRPGRSVVQWAEDVTELRDHLGFDDFAAMGWSMGGQYALALGFALEPRVRRVAVIAGGLPLTEPGRFEEMPLVDRFYIRLSQRTPWLARQCLWSMGTVARFAPGVYGRLTARELPSADGAVIRDEGFATFGRRTAEAMRQPEGHVDDYLAAMQPWGFAPEDVDVPVDVWAGADDVFLNPGWPAELAHRIPKATLNTRSGGHFVAHLHWTEIFQALRR
ncbi:alpha/beta fold hydrolase [Mycolicibacterium psychrotolerans]|uniref:Alpha/beta hydrolase n=1 Tax=Mycolicibacterium psychrotolerans TaxID=216929 RepID=A0A7I7M9W3_9MYCO|nr:alpha/beta hydrolase [Mycolicibacterium psychrotolerans]BBX68657.1 alpha/beta hydrolase [Mycolicibacterium psychrotolerans]